MERFFYTVCRNGVSVTGDDGFQVRAATPALNPGFILQHCMGAIAYEPPRGVDVEQLTGANSPVKLIYYRAGGVSMLGRICWTGHDAEDRYRLGNFFADVLIGLPETMDALEAVCAWDAPFWHDRALGESTCLDSVPALPRNDVFPDETAELQLRHETAQTRLTWLINAFLSRQSHQRLIICANPRDVAILVYGLCSCLPPSWRREVTFSTYEESPEKAATVIMGTTRLKHAEDFDEFWYSSGGKVLNLETGRQSETVSSFYAKHIVSLFCNGDRTKLDHLLARLDSCNLGAAKHLDLGLRILMGDFKGLENEDLYAVVELSSLFGAAVAQEEFCAHFAEALILSNPPGDLWPSLGAQLGDKRQPAQFVAALARVVATNLVRAAEPAQLMERLEVVDAILFVPDSQSLAFELLQEVLGMPSPAELRRPARWFLLAWWAGKPGLLDDTRFLRVLATFLAMGPDEFKSLIDADLPESIKVLAFMLATENTAAAPPGWMADLRSRQTVLDSTLRYLCARPQLHMLAVRLFVGSFPPTVARARALPKSGMPHSVLEGILEEYGKALSPREWLLLSKKDFAALIRAVPESTAMSAICARIIAVLSPAGGGENSHIAMLRFWLESGVRLTGPASERARALVHLGDYLAHPALDRESIVRLADLIERVNGQGDAAFWSTLMEVMVRRIEGQAGMELFLVSMGSVYPGGMAALFCRLCDVHCEHQKYLRRLGATSAFLLIALGEAQSELLRSQTRSSSEAQNKVAKIISQLRGSDLERLDRESAQWSACARSAWRNLARPRNKRNFLCLALLVTLLMVFLALYFAWHLRPTSIGSALTDTNRVLQQRTHTNQLGVKHAPEAAGISGLPIKERSTPVPATNTLSLPLGQKGNQRTLNSVDPEKSQSIPSIRK